MLLKIPFDRWIACMYAQGKTIVDVMPSWRARYQELYKQMQEVLS